MKRLLILMLAVILAVTPLCAYAQSYRDWWPKQVDENDLHYNFNLRGMRNWKYRVSGGGMVAL